MIDGDGIACDQHRSNTRGQADDEDEVARAVYEAVDFDI